MISESGSECADEATSVDEVDDEAKELEVEVAFAIAAAHVDDVGEEEDCRWCERDILCVRCRAEAQRYASTDLDGEGHGHTRMDKGFWGKMIKKRKKKVQVQQLLHSHTDTVVSHNVSIMSCTSALHCTAAPPHTPNNTHTSREVRTTYADSHTPTNAPRCAPDPSSVKSSSRACTLRTRRAAGAERK